MKVKYDINLGLVKDMTVFDVRRIKNDVLKSNGSSNAGIDQNLAIAAMFVCKELERYKFTSLGLKLTIEMFYNLRVKFGEEFIHIHRLNFMAYRNVRDTYDWLEEKKMLTPNVKRFWKKVDKAFSDYQSVHKSQIEHSSYVTVQDHVRLASDLIQPLIEKLEVSIRDYLIQNRNQMMSSGQIDDIALLTKVQTGIMFCAALRNTYNNFLKDCTDKYGVDLTPDYAYADISSIGRNFVWMMEQLGVKFDKDKDGDFILKGIDMESSMRVESAWDAIVNVVTDEKVMDETALAAINMNPKCKAEYERILAREDEANMVKAMGDLGRKFKVGRL